MNRETKIGLVTGVTLIVLIGAMLSSYLSAPHDKIGDLSISGLGRTLRNQISNPVGIAQVPVPQKASIRPPQPAVVAAVPSAVVPPAMTASTQYNQVTQLPYGASPNTPRTALVQTAATATAAVMPVVVARQPSVAVAAGTANAAASSQTATYTVRPGDTLGKIAWHFYHDAGPVALRRIVNANRSELSSVKAMIRVGETLQIPAVNQGSTSHLRLMTMAAQTAGNLYSAKTGSQRRTAGEPARVRTYRVQSGDTLWGIAQKTMGAGTDANVHRIMVLNHIRNARTIAVGETLKIPS
jgi:nucleoid-associated protein YgaU